jgi:hypothetical protein
VSEDVGIEPGTVATSALAVRRSNHKARSHLLPARLDLYLRLGYFPPLMLWIRIYMYIGSRSTYTLYSSVLIRSGNADLDPKYDDEEINWIESVHKKETLDVKILFK